MLKVKRTIALFLAIIMSVAMCTMSPVMAATVKKVMFIDFTDTSAETLPMTNPDANAGGRIDKCTTITYDGAPQSGIWAVTGTKSSLNQYLVSDSGIDLTKVAECDSFVMRLYSELDNDVFNVAFNYHDDVKADGYIAKQITITRSGWQEIAIPVSEIAAKLKDGDISNFYSFSLNKGGWGTADLFNKENDICFDSMWFEKRTSSANVVVDADDAALSLTANKSQNVVSVNTTTVYEDSRSSIAWYATAAGGSADSVSLDTLGLSDPTTNTKLTFRLYSDAADIVNLMVYYTNTDGATGKYVREPYTFSEEAGNIGKWVEVTLDLTCIDTKDVNLTTAATKLETVKLNRGSWSTASTYNNNLYIDKIWFGDEDVDNVEVTYPEIEEPEVELDENEPTLTLIDFRDTSVELLPMTNPEANAGGRIDKCTYNTYGAAEQSGIWAVTGTKSSLEQYLISDSNLDLEKVAQCNSFIIRLHSELDNDVFNVVFNYHDDVKEDGYFSRKVTISKAGWQEIIIPVADIAAELKDGDIANLYSFSLNKGGWGTADLFNKENDICFDKMWFEKRMGNVVVDADNTLLGLTPGSNKNKISYNTTTVYSDSTSSIAWYNTAAGGAAESVSLETLGLSDPTTNTKLTFRLYSDAADIVNLMVYYTNTDGVAGKYVREPYTFSEEAGNIGKWVEVTLDLTCIDTKDVNLTTAATKLETVKLNRGSWSTASTYNNNVYIDKIWFGDVEDINATFSYKDSAYDGATDVGAYETVTLEFEDYLGETIACDAVYVKRGGNEVTEFTAWADRNFLCVKMDSAMIFNSTYEITVTPALKDQRGYSLYGTHTISFKVESPCLAINDIEIVDLSGNKLTAIPEVGTGVVAISGIVNGSETAETYIMAIAMYDIDGKLLSVKVCEPKLFEANMTVEHPISQDDVVVEGAASIRGFLWNGFTTMKPVKEAGEL